MDEQQEIYEVKPMKNILMRIIITQVVCVTVLIAVIIVLKLFFGSYYDSVESWYNENIRSQTTVSEILDSSGGEKDEV
ncbi:MAG: hypothetical protein IJ470_00085 [Clostridia bacterium]|nr:hypothetical protein [Clostridia bacterium]